MPKKSDDVSFIQFGIININKSKHNIILMQIKYSLTLFYN